MCVRVCVFEYVNAFVLCVWWLVRFICAFLVLHYAFTFVSLFHSVPFLQPEFIIAVYKDVVYCPYVVSMRVINLLFIQLSRRKYVIV